MFSTIVAVAKNGVIGKEGGLPWYLPAELAHFKKVTMGHPIIMGRKTHESIGRTLSGRTNIVITSNLKYKASEGSIAVNSLDEAIKTASKSEGSDEIFIIGGEQIYKEAMPLLNKIYITKVDLEADGDKYFHYEEDGWQETSRQSHTKDAQNQYNYDFIELERKQPKKD